MADKRGNIVLRFGIIYVLIILAFAAVVVKIIQIQTTEREQLIALGNKSKKTDIVIKPNRGNIYASDGRLMASSIPSYYIYMDMRVEALHKVKKKDDDSLFKNNVDSLAYCLSNMFNDRSKAEYKRMLVNAHQRKDPELLLYPKRISYAQLKELRTFPLFRLGRNRSGLIPKEYVERVKPFGSLASRTIGDVYADESMGGKNGVELNFNSTLCGKPGVSVRQKVANIWLETTEVEPIPGNDIVTTIDINMQDLAERSLLQNLNIYQAQSGYVILMEVKTGEVKAIVNMQRNNNGTYSENRNGAVADQVEPGSTFKTVSLVAALDDGKISLSDTINVGAGTYMYGTTAMNDHNKHRGGYGKITLEQGLNASSNIAISRAIVKAYGSNPNEFINKLHKMGIEDSMKIEIPGAAAPRIPHPSDKRWSRTTLPWMSIGYEVQMPPIYTLAFYNAIANEGKMIRPYFVKSISSGGRVVKSFSTETIRSSICSQSTLNEIRRALLGVVEGNLGTAKNIRSPYVRMAGKTGTALISQGRQGYRSEGSRYQVSFCGYFPADNPQYTCIVVLREPQGTPSGGGMAGIVFKNIAEGVMAMNSELTPVQFALDSTIHLVKTPRIKNGSYTNLRKVVNVLDLPMVGEGSNWVQTHIDNEQINVKPLTIIENLVPNVVGMGARDAVYLMENCGLYVNLSGKGKVRSQSMQPGIRVVKGATVRLELE